MSRISTKKGQMMMLSITKEALRARNTPEKRFV